MSIDQAEHGVRARTRQAILDAAASVWARNYSASFSEIAVQAEVSRSTLHRYFTDRQALIDALLVDSLARFESMGPLLEGATSAMDLLERRMRAGIELGDRVIFLFSDPDRFEGNPHWPADDGEPDDLAAIMNRARIEGSMAETIPDLWATNLFYALLYTAAETSQQGLPRHVTADLAVAAFLCCVAA